MAGRLVGGMTDSGRSSGSAPRLLPAKAIAVPLSLAALEYSSAWCAAGQNGNQSKLHSSDGQHARSCEHLQLFWHARSAQHQLGIGVGCQVSTLQQGPRHQLHLNQRQPARERPSV